MMAAKYVKMFINNLSCPVCCELFKNPKFLPCHHSYCEQCLARMVVQYKVICPECRKEAIVPPEGVKGFDSNFLVNRMLEDFIKTCTVEGMEEVKCSKCDGEDPVVVFCPNCTSFLCQVCNEDHKHSFKSRSHGIVPLTEPMSKKDVTIQPKPKAMMCKKHDTELLFYCETCDQLVCMYCTVKDHNGHSLNKQLQGQELKKITPVEEMIEGLSDTCD